jgi:hypothetical protein
MKHVLAHAAQAGIHFASWRAGMLFARRQAGMKRACWRKLAKFGTNIARQKLSCWHIDNAAACRYNRRQLK